jgi:hypothetical protein
MKRRILLNKIAIIGQKNATLVAAPYTEDCRTEFDPHWYRKLQDRYCSLYPDDTKLDASYFVSSDRGIVI